MPFRFSCLLPDLFRDWLLVFLDPSNTFPPGPPCATTSRPWICTTVKTDHGLTTRKTPRHLDHRVSRFPGGDVTNQILRAGNLGPSSGTSCQQETQKFCIVHLGRVVTCGSGLFFIASNIVASRIDGDRARVHQTSGLRRHPPSWLLFVG